MNFAPCDQLTIRTNVFPEEDECLGEMNSLMTNYSLFEENLCIYMYKIN